MFVIGTTRLIIYIVVVTICCHGTTRISEIGIDCLCPKEIQSAFQKNKTYI